jgi:hypothetical protein
MCFPVSTSTTPPTLGASGIMNATACAAIVGFFFLLVGFFFASLLR